MRWKKKMQMMKMKMQMLRKRIRDILFLI